MEHEDDGDVVNTFDFDDEHRDHDEVLGRDGDRDRAEAQGASHLALSTDRRGSRRGNDSE